MRYAPVASLAAYDMLWEYDMLGDYHLLIATEVVKDVDAWHNFWVADQLSLWNRFVIMDNGLIETGAPTDPQTLKDAADAVNASCIVLPDVLGDYEKTVKAVKASLLEMLQIGRPLMGVIQGRNWNEIDNIAQFYTDIQVDYLSVPRVMTNIFGTRLSLIHRLRGYNKPIHLLGFSENMWDDMLSAVQPDVMGIDSATPLWYTDDFPKYPPTQANFGPRPKDYWSMDPATINYPNIERVHAWLTAAMGVPTPAGLREPEVTL